MLFFVKDNEPYCYESRRICSVFAFSKACYCFTIICCLLNFCTNCSLCYCCCRKLKDKYFDKEECISSYKEEQIVRRGRETIRKPFYGSGSYSCFCLTLTSCFCYCCTCGINLTNYFFGDDDDDDDPQPVERCFLFRVCDNERDHSDIAKRCLGKINYFHCC